MSKPDWAERLQRTFRRRFEAGQQFERERIIKLLDDSAQHDVTSGTIATGHLDLECSTCQLIALIKGENK